MGCSAALTPRRRLLRRYRRHQLVLLTSKAIPSSRRDPSRRTSRARYVGRHRFAYLGIIRRLHSASNNARGVGRGQPAQASQAVGRSQRSTAAQEVAGGVGSGRDGRGANGDFGRDNGQRRVWINQITFRRACASYGTGGGDSSETSEAASERVRRGATPNSWGTSGGSVLLLGLLAEAATDRIRS
jgi:hypothetical protein